MAGHSKWTNIQHRKYAQDLKKSQLFTRLIREVTIAARNGIELEQNPHLRLAVSKALAANLSRSRIDNAIQKVTQPTQETTQEVIYEGYGPYGIAILIHTFTDNRNRTAATLRHIFQKNGGKLGVTGTVTHLFKRKGWIKLDDVKISEETLMEYALTMSIEDIVYKTQQKTYPIFVTSCERFDITLRHIQEKFSVQEAKLIWLPMKYFVIKEKSKREQIHALLTALDEVSDVHTVHSNYRFP